MQGFRSGFSHPLATLCRFAKSEKSPLGLTVLWVGRAIQIGADMEADELFDPPLEVKLTSSHGSATLHSPVGLKTWFEKERDWLRALRDQANGKTKDVLPSQIFQILVQNAQRRSDEIQQLIVSKADRSAFEQRLGISLTEYSDKRAVHSEGIVGKQLTEFSQTDPSQALRIAVCYCSVRFGVAQTDFAGHWMKAAATAVAWEYGTQDSSIVIEEMLFQFGDRWDKNFDVIADRQKQVLSEQGDTLEHFQVVSRETESLLTEYRTKSNDALMTGAAELVAIKDTYRTELALQAPTTYWSEKEGSHQTAAGRWAIGFGVAAVVGAAFVWAVWQFTAQPHLAIAQSGNFSPSYGAFLPTAGAAFLVVWVLRILSRQLLANFALSSDAGERVAMVKTFLALMQKPEHVHEPDRILILSSLFRPASQSSDDATPPNWFDMLMQRVNKKPD